MNKEISIIDWSKKMKKEISIEKKLKEMAEKRKSALIEGILSLKTHDELDDLIGAFKSARKAIDAKEVAMKRHLFRVGQTVNVVEKTKTTQGTIKKVNKTRCHVDINGKTWAVPMSMIEVV
jgi:hypothetical protein